MSDLVGNPEDPVSHNEAHKYELFAPDPPENASITGQDVIKIDDHLELTCLAYANPMPSFTWIEDGPTFGNGMRLKL